MAWTYDSHDAFKGSEMQSNPIVVDGVLYATTPKLRVIALDAATGREIWSFDPKDKTKAREDTAIAALLFTATVSSSLIGTILWALDRSAASLR